MHRRNFLQLAGAAGLTAFLPRRARADVTRHAGPYWLCIHAGGGWDPTLLFDPKGGDADDPEAINRFSTEEIGEVGPFRHAPVDGHAAFLQRFSPRLTVINGIDTGTNSHTTGTRTTWSGSPDLGGAALGAVIAASTPGPALPWLSDGGYRETGGLVSLTRLPDADTIGELAFPERRQANNEGTAFHPPAVLERIAQAREARLQQQMAEVRLPGTLHQLAALERARSGTSELAELREVLANVGGGGGNSLLPKVQVAMACFSAGLSVSASLSLGGFDTHGDHDSRHTPRLQEILDAVTFAYDEAAEHGIAELLYVVVGSDFGRTPTYNNGNGKDHWPITSMLVLGPGLGPRVVGGSGPRFGPLAFDPDTLQADPNGVRITPAHVHAALWELAGVPGSIGLTAPGERLPIFG